MSTTSDLRRGALAPQHGERGTSLESAWQHGAAAVAELGLTMSLTPAPPVENPGAWRCLLQREGVQVPGGDGAGKGDTAAARVGAVYEALEHHLSCETVWADSITLRSPHEVAVGPLAQDAGLAMLAEGPNTPLACLAYRNARDEGELVVPAFFSNPDYLSQNQDYRAALGDHYNYRRVGRYSVNSGWAAGTTTVEATVHAINEIIERDAMSLFLVSQFLHQAPPPLKLLDSATLPAELFRLYQTAQHRVGGPVYLMEMTTDLGIPAYWAYHPAPAGQAARVRGCGASLSRHYAIERALTELIQLHSAQSLPGKPAQPVHTTPFPALHRCYLADFSCRLATAQQIPFTDTAAPSTPEGHREALLDRLTALGLSVWVWKRYESDHAAVLNVHIPGLERFFVVTDGQLVLPGPRGHRQPPH
jgi:ribosomal protein S12 methylthiotransferase accessory factor